MNLEILNKSEITKTDIEMFTNTLMKNIDDGLMNPLDVATKVKVLEDLAKSMKGAITSEALVELEKYSIIEKVLFNGIEIGRSQRKGAIDFESDPEYKNLKDQLDERKQQLNDSYTQFQKGNELVINGELIPVCKIKTHGSTFLTFKMKK